MVFYYFLSKLKQKLLLTSFEVLYKQGKVNPPASVVWDCTKRCNLDCVHCGSQGSYGKELNTEEIKDLVDQLAVFGVRNFQITGGEPLLRHDFIEVISHANKRGLNTSFASNGFYIDRKKAEAISKSNVSLIQISVDGTKEIHDSIRKHPESFDKAINAIKLLKKYSAAKVSVATTVMPQNIGALSKLRDLLTLLNVDFWAIGIVMPIGKAKANSSLFLSKEQFAYLMKFVIDSKKFIDIEITENFPYLGRFDNVVRRAPKMCPVGFLSCCIGVDGHVRGCPDQPDNAFYREGSIQNQAFEEIWKKSFERYRKREILERDRNCSKCAQKNDCFGGCWVMRENNSHCILNYLGGLLI